MKYCIELSDYWSINNIKQNVKLGINTCFVKHPNNDIGFLFGGMDEQFNICNKLYSFDFNTCKLKNIYDLSIQGRINSKLYYGQDDKLIIVGGSSYIKEFSNRTYYNEIIIFDLKNNEINTLQLPENILNKGQFSSCFDSINETIYIFGGFDDNGLCEDIYSLDIKRNNFNKIIPEGCKMNKRAGMVTELLPNGKILIFSGFGKENGIPVCYNDYYLYNIINNNMVYQKTNELVGRSFAKSIIIPSINKVLFYGGSPNGMEGYGTFYYYDYINEKFGVCDFEPLPSTCVSPIIFYSENLNKIFIITTSELIGRNFRLKQRILILDLKKIKIK